VTPLLQEVLVLVSVSAAAIWLAVSWWRRRADGRCDGCSQTSIAARTRTRAVRSPALRVLR
jgi:hypothetical protein